MDKLNVAIADDNEIMLQMLDHIVSSDEELQVVGKAGDGEELIEIIREKKPDVVLLDIIMPKLDGLTVMDRVNQYRDYLLYTSDCVHEQVAKLGPVSRAAGMDCECPLYWLEKEKK